MSESSPTKKSPKKSKSQKSERPLRSRLTRCMKDWLFDYSYNYRNFMLEGTPDEDLEKASEFCSKNPTFVSIYKREDLRGGLINNKEIYVVYKNKNGGSLSSKQKRELEEYLKSAILHMFKNGNTLKFDYEDTKTHSMLKLTIVNGSFNKIGYRVIDSILRTLRGNSNNFILNMGISNGLIIGVNNNV